MKGGTNKRDEQIWLFHINGAAIYKLHDPSMLDINEIIYLVFESYVEKAATKYDLPFDINLRVIMIRFYSYLEGNIFMLFA